eukprot:4471189-Heterocapsa_arctica.AAC.1
MSGDLGVQDDFHLGGDLPDSGSQDEEFQHPVLSFSGTHVSTLPSPCAMNPPTGSVAPDSAIISGV